MTEQNNMTFVLDVDDDIEDSKMGEETNYVNLQRLIWDIGDFFHFNGHAYLFEKEILVMFAIKRLSDAFDEDSEEKHLDSYLTRSDCQELAPNVDKGSSKFFLPESARWSNFRNLRHKIGDELDASTRAIEYHNPSLCDLLSTAYFNNSSLNDQNLQDLLVLFSKFSMRNRDLESPDVLRDTFHHFMKEFAESAGTCRDEIYTPNEVETLLLLNR